MCEVWQRDLLEAVVDPAIPAQRFQLQVRELEKVIECFPFRIPRYYWSLIEEKFDPIYLQCIPDYRELIGNENLLVDPLGEDVHSPHPLVVHRYPDRCLLLAGTECAMHCRFCTRKRRFCRGVQMGKSDLDQALEYIRSRDEIRDVLISGGDPLLLPDETLEYLLRNLKQIRHLDLIRIGSRAVCTLPSRVTENLCQMLKKYQPIYMNVHFNHPRELTVESERALNMLADAGVVLGNQTVLLRNVNDNPEVLRELFYGLLRNRVKPYYLHQCDLVYGIEHFRTPLACGVDIMQQLRGWCSGMAIPHFAVDLPGGGGKVELAPEYLVRKDADGRGYMFRNYRGELFHYPEVEEA